MSIKGSTYFVVKVVSLVQRIFQIHPKYVRLAKLLKEEDHLEMVWLGVNYLGCTCTLNTGTGILVRWHQNPVENKQINKHLPSLECKKEVTDNQQ